MIYSSDRGLWYIQSSQGSLSLEFRTDTVGGIRLSPDSLLSPLWIDETVHSDEDDQHSEDDDIHIDSMRSS